MAGVWLLALEALDPSDTPVTLRCASAAYTDAVHWDVRLIQPALYSVGAFGSSLAGAARSGYGEASLVNIDGGLDGLVDFALDGRVATLSLADGGTVTQVLRATVSRLSYGDGEVSIALRDPQEALKQPHPHAVYAGNNAPPAGLEGVASDIKGQWKPQVYGKVRNATPQLVNTARLIFQVDSGSASTVTAVYDRGVALTAGAAYPDLATLQSTAPAAGSFRAFQGYFRLGATPAGQVTADVDGSPAGLGSVFAQIASQVGQTVNASDVTAANALGDVGVYVDRERSTADLLDHLADSMGGYWSMDAGGVIRLRQILAPASPALTLYEYEIVSIDRESSGAGESGLPVWRVVVRADRVETVQTDVASSATNAARVANQYREAVAEDSATKTRHPLADELVIESDLRALTDAQTQATRLLALLKVRRDRVKVGAVLSQEKAAAIAIGLTITVITHKLGYAAGRDFVVLGYTLDANTMRVDLDLWG